jgi:predicted O-methyltransferase YrrM
VGSYLGLSATLVADACPQALIFAHDVFPMSGSDGALDPGTHPPPGTEKLLLRFWTNVARNGLEGRVVPMRGFSQETLPVHADASLDMAFVDGDHSYATTMADLRQIWAKVCVYHI